MGTVVAAQQNYYYFSDLNQYCLFQRLDRRRPAKDDVCPLHLKSQKTYDDWEKSHPVSGDLMLIVSHHVWLKLTVVVVYLDRDEARCSLCLYSPKVGGRWERRWFPQRHAFPVTMSWDDWTLTWTESPGSTT